MSKQVSITTIDNPFDYFTQFDLWSAFDHQMGYNTMEYLARIAKISDDLSDESIFNELEFAIDSIIEWNGSFYKKIYYDESSKNQKDAKESKK